jgi:hypothetical protein
MKINEKNWTVFSMGEVTGQEPFFPKRLFSSKSPTILSQRFPITLQIKLKFVNDFIQKSLLVEFQFASSKN